MSRNYSSALEWASRVLGEALMGFLALVALATAIGPLVFDVSAETDALLTVVEWGVLGLFVAEFAVKFAVAPDKRTWLRDPWRIVDAICIGGPLLSLLPQVSDTVRGTLVFRFLRVGRAVAFGARAGASVVQKRQEAGREHVGGATHVTMVSAATDKSIAEAAWPDLLAGLGGSQPTWYHAAGAEGSKLFELARAAGLTGRDRDQFLNPEAPPRIKSDLAVTIMLLSLPNVERDAFPTVTRTRVVALVSGATLVTATSQHFELPEQLAAEGEGDTDLATVNFPERVMFEVLLLVRDRTAAIAHRHEEEILRLEDVRANEGGGAFLNQAFRLQREISGVASDLWHLKGVVRLMADGKVPLPGIDARNLPFLDNLQTEVDELYERFGELKDSLKSLMELHMNVTSFEMNKFMKLLAIVGFLGLIPSVAGGLLGMNVAGNPWSVTLGQVAFGIGMGMAISLYIFAIKGWLR